MTDSDLPQSMIRQANWLTAGSGDDVTRIQAFWLQTSLQGGQSLIAANICRLQKVVRKRRPPAQRRTLPRPESASDRYCR